jgi:hypothetical protein
VIREAGEELGRQLKAWLGSGEAPAPVRVETREVEPPQPLFDQVMDYVATAKTVQTLGKIGDRIDVLESEGQLDAEQAAALRAAIGARHDVIQPNEAASA